MNYSRLTIPNLTPVRCKETKYTQYQVVWYEDHGYLMSQIELDIDKAQKLLTKHLGGIYNND